MIEMEDIINVSKKKRKKEISFLFNFFFFDRLRIGSCNKDAKLVRNFEKSSQLNCLRILR